MQTVFETRNLTKQFGDKVVLNQVDLTLAGPAIIGLLGKNGCGKTTLIRHMVGQYLPTDGQVFTLGKPVGELGHVELARLGYVPQEIQLLDWMDVGQHLDYVASFYPSWDKTRQDRLLAELELDRGAQVGELSTGNLQKLAILVAVCHHPDFLVLDEPVSDLDPIVRANLLVFLQDLLRDDGATVLVSSHILRDVEKVVDRVICMNGSGIAADESLDELKEQYCEWMVWSPSGTLPGRFEEPYVLRQEVDGARARLLVRDGDAHAAVFRSYHQVELKQRPLNLEEMFPLLLEA